MQSLSHVRAPLADLEELLAESEALPAVMPEADAIKVRLARCACWACFGCPWNLPF